MAPEELAEPWDNCGLVIASESMAAGRVIVCLDVTRAVMEEAIASRAQLIVSHHPLIFNPIRRIGRDSGQDYIIRGLIRNDIALYSAHTNVDKTYGGLNDLLAGIVGVETPDPHDSGEPLNYYRVGDLPRGYTVDEFNEHVGSRLKLNNLTVSRFAAPPVKPIRRVLVMCGSYDLDARKVVAAGADALLCGEIRHHEALELTALGIHIVQAGHHGTERFFINLVIKWINEKYPDLEIEGAGFSDIPTEIYRGANVNGDV